MDNLIKYNFIGLAVNITCMILVLFGIITGLIPSNIRQIILAIQLFVCGIQAVLCFQYVKKISGG